MKHTRLKGLMWINIAVLIAASCRGKDTKTKEFTGFYEKNSIYRYDVAMSFFKYITHYISNSLRMKEVSS